MATDPADLFTSSRWVVVRLDGSSYGYDGDPDDLAFLTRVEGRVVHEVDLATLGPAVGPVPATPKAPTRPRKPRSTTAQLARKPLGPPPPWFFRPRRGQPFWTRTDPATYTFPYSIQGYVVDEWDWVAVPAGGGARYMFNGDPRATGFFVQEIRGRYIFEIDDPGAD